MACDVPTRTGTWFQEGLQPRGRSGGAPSEPRRNWLLTLRLEGGRIGGGGFSALSPPAASSPLRLAATVLRMQEGTPSSATRLKGADADAIAQSHHAACTLQGQPLHEPPDEADGLLPLHMDHI